MAKKKSGAGAEREKLAKELAALVPHLDSEGLAFLVEQAGIHIHNMRVIKAAEDGKGGAKTAAARGSGKGAPKGGAFKIVGSESGSSYYLYFRGNEVMFSRAEMTRLVKIVNAAGTDPETRERLYDWFDRERRDVFSVVPAADKFDPRLKELAALIKKTFAIRER